MQIPFLRLQPSSQEVALLLKNSTSPAHSLLSIDSMTAQHSSVIALLRPEQNVWNLFLRARHSSLFFLTLLSARSSAQAISSIFSKTALGHSWSADLLQIPSSMLTHIASLVARSRTMVPSP